MRYLIDTCVFIWALEENTQKLGDFSLIFYNPNCKIVASVVSYWEILLKQSKGGVDLKGDFIKIAEETLGIEWMPIELKHIHQIKNLPPLHKDPFDRLLVVQSIIENIPLLTHDEEILRYFPL